MYVQHPFTKKWTRISLKVKNVGAIVFWSKNFSPLLDKLDIIEKTTTNLFFHFTVTANRELEFNTPDYRDAIRDFIFLTARYSSEQLIWRFDPICITDKLSYETHEERFVKCAEMLKGYARKCYVSFAHPYKKVAKNLQQIQQPLADLPTEGKKAYALKLAEVAETYGMQIYACCNDYLLSEKIRKASCINGNYLSNIFNTSIEANISPTRKECACTKSVDIGTYDTCAHSCMYCYANTDKDEAATAPLRQDPEWNSLGTNVRADEVELSINHQQAQIKYPGIRGDRIE